MELSPVHDPLSPTQKSAAQTLEGKLASLVTIAGSLVAILGVLLDAGVFGPHDGTWAIAIGGVLALAQSLGFGQQRTSLKAAANEATAKAAALIESAKTGNPSQP